MLLNCPELNTISFASEQSEKFTSWQSVLQMFSKLVYKCYTQVFIYNCRIPVKHAINTLNLA